MRSSSMGDRTKTPINVPAGKIQKQHKENDDGHPQNTKHFLSVGHLFRF